MRNPLLDKRHLKEYVIYCLIAAVAYIVPYLIFLTRGDYEDFYYLFLGAGLFMLAIFYYCFHLLRKPYDKNRALSMTISGHFTTITGIAISCFFVVILFSFFYPGVYSSLPPDKVIKDLPATMQTNKPLGVLFPILFVTILGNFGVGSFISIITAYAGKLNQTKEKAVPLETNI